MLLKSIDSSSLVVQRNLTNLFMNYIALAPGVPTRMHFTDDYLVEREIADKETGKPKTISGRVYWVDELNGEVVARTFSVLSQKLNAHLEPFRKDKEYTGYDFIITQIGEGFMKDWGFQPIKRPE